MIRLDVPLLPDVEYCRFLQSHTTLIHSIHFSVLDVARLDARFSITGSYEDDLINHLNLFPSQKKYGLLNSRFYAPNIYLENESLPRIIEALQFLTDKRCLNGIVFADFYLLQALSRLAPRIANKLEAVPSVNCMIDGFDKLCAVMEIIETTNFKLPSKFILDRSLNRQVHALESLIKQIRKKFPGRVLELIANEGCLYQCPFKPAHDSHISFANTGNAIDHFKMNNELGCVNIVNKKPERLLKSPFIRPEDVNHYDGIIDVVKLCGRTLGADFLMRTIAAYICREYHGNLLDVTDTMEWLAQKIDIPNEQIPRDFFKVVTACDKVCAECTYCKELFDKIARPLPLRIKDFRPNA